MDRRVSLPGFSEIAGALPRPAPLSPSMPQVVYRGHPTRKSASPLSSPSPHGISVTALHPAEPGEAGGDASHYALNAKPIGNSQQYDQIKVPHSYSYPSSHSVPQQLLHVTPRGAATHGAPLPQMSLDTKSCRSYHQHNGQGYQKESYGMHDGVIAVHDAQQTRVYGNGVYPVAKLAKNPAEGRMSLSSVPPSFITASSSLMHTTLPPRYTPYQISNSSMASASAPTFAPSGSVTTIASAASAPARISPKPQLSPKYHRPRGITTNDAVSRANASSSSLSFATAATQRRRNAIGAVTSAPQIPRRTPPRMPPNISTTQRHIPTALHTMREHSVPELIGERNEDDMDENDSLGCYDEVHHGLDKTVDADGTLMSSAKIRTIHKLAERRRRREMKNLFDTLRRCLPIDKTIRLSKWEVLKKAIEVISNQDAEIRMLRLHIDSAKSLPSSSPH